MRGHAYKREKALQLQKALQKQLKLTNDPTLALEEILMKVKETYKERRRCKDLAEILTPRVWSTLWDDVRPFFINRWFVSVWQLASTLQTILFRIFVLYSNLKYNILWVSQEQQDLSFARYKAAQRA